VHERQPIIDLVQANLEVTAPITQMLDPMMRAPGEPEIDGRSGGLACPPERCHVEGAAHRGADSPTR
jgi:hypothetical protein